MSYSTDEFAFKMRREAEHTIKILDELDALRRNVTQLVTALRQSQIALDDWVCLYAPDECDENRVAETNKRIFESGLLIYVSNIQNQIREAIIKSQI